MSDTYKIVIIDDHKLFSDGLLRILEDEPDFSVVGICSNGNELRQFLNKCIPDLLMLDIQMSGASGIELCEGLKKTNPGIKIILISMFESARVIGEVILAGADGYLPKTTDAYTVKETIRSVMQGSNTFVKPDKGEEQTPANGTADPFLLSKREKEVLVLVKEGLTAKEISGELNISQYTVETHRKNMLKKLNLKSIKELIAFAYENNF